MVHISEGFAVVGQNLYVEAAQTALLLLCKTSLFTHRTIEPVHEGMVAGVVKEISYSPCDVEVFDRVDGCIPFGIKNIHQQLVCVVKEVGCRV